MVFQDINSTLIQTPKKTTAPAKIIDRVFSFVIDYLVLSPFVMFALYLSFNNGFVFAKNNPLAPENDVFYILMGLSFILIFGLVQLVFVEIWQATPGQYFLKVKFEFEETDSLSMVRLYFRQLLFWGSFLGLGIPFLSVLTNKRRRTFYDQVADVSVVTSKSEAPSFSFENEHRYWRALVATLTVFFVFMMTSFVWSNYGHVVGRTISFSQLQEQKFFCEELQSVDYSKRLDTAVALNLVNQLSDDCLNHEADFVLWKQKYENYSMAYYAKSLTTDDAEKEKQYLQKACEPQSGVTSEGPAMGCQIAKAFETENYEELYGNLLGDDLLTVVLKYEMAGQLEKKGEQQELFGKLAQYNDLRPLRKYQLLEMLGEGDSVIQPARAPASVPEQEIEAYSKVKPQEVPPEARVEKSGRHEKIMELLENL